MSNTVGETPTLVKSPKVQCFGLSPTAAVLLLKPRMEDRQFQRKAIYVLRENIRVLLDARKEDQQTLARYCGHDKSWINKFLNEGRGRLVRAPR